MKDKILLQVWGPTASGKTAFAAHIAQCLQTEVISCDSRQFYKEMQIGTARPKPDELLGIPHHFLGHLSIHDAYSVGHFERDALGLLSTLFKAHPVVVMAGGSSLFARAVSEGLDEFPEVPQHILTKVEELEQNEGLPGLQHAVQLADPTYWNHVDQQNPARLRRALQVSWATNQPFSSYRTGAPAPRPFTTIKWGLYPNREWLYERINQRVDLMVEEGLIQEAQALHPYKHLQALQTVGYAELFDHFAGMCTLEEAINRIKQNSRNFAKRQLTWMRKEPGLKLFETAPSGTELSQLLHNLLT